MAHFLSFLKKKDEEEDEGNETAFLMSLVRRVWTGILRCGTRRCVGAGRSWKWWKRACLQES